MAGDTKCRPIIAVGVLAKFILLCFYTDTGFLKLSVQGSHAYIECFGKFFHAAAVVLTHLF